MVHSQFLRHFTITLRLLVVLVLMVSAAQTSLAAPAHFWISDESVSTDGPEDATNISITQGEIGSLHIWGRPETGKKLRNISLNLVAMQAGIDFIDASITIHNDVGNGRERFEYISDSTSTPALESEETLFDVGVSGQADSIELLQGYTISSSSADIQGFGDQCVGGELGCVIAGDGEPAWLIASVEYNAIVGGPVTQLFLQIGEHGINHESLVDGDYDRNGVVDSDDLAEAQSHFFSTTNLWPDGNDDGRVDAADYTVWRDNLGSVSEFESASLTSVRFGPDDKDDGFPEPIYNGTTDRDVTLVLDDPDATITITAPLLAEQTTVPEPTTLGLMLISLLGFSNRQRNRPLQG